MKHKLSACILIPILAGYLYSVAKVGIKMQELSLYFISAACFSAFIAVPTNTEISIFSCTCLCTFLADQLYSYMHSRKHVQI